MTRNSMHKIKIFITRPCSYLCKLPFVRRLKDLQKMYFDCAAALKLLKEGGLASTAVVVREANIKRQKTITCLNLSNGQIRSSIRGQTRQRGLLSDDFYMTLEGRTVLLKFQVFLADLDEERWMFVEQRLSSNVYRSEISLVYDQPS